MYKQQTSHLEKTVTNERREDAITRNENLKKKSEITLTNEKVKRDPLCLLCDK